jgi:ribulose-bisphosphate carboxylase large chain
MAYIDLRYRPSPGDLVCSFLVRPERGLTVARAAEEVAAESSVGTWTEVHTERRYMRDLAARVFSLNGNEARIAYPAALFEDGNIPQVLSSVAGNVFGMKAVRSLRLQDIAIPRALLKSFPGPAYGIGGVRKVLGVEDRPLVGTIIKPKLGLRTADHAEVAYQAWAGGCDIVKDDENLTGQGFNPFEERVLRTLEMRDRAEEETGERKAYMPNVTAEANEMLRRAEFVERHGGTYAMVDVVTCGFSAVQSLRTAGFRLVLHAHRAMHAAFTRDPEHGVSMLCLAKLSRLAGMDQMHIGTAFGKMEGSAGQVRAIAQAVQRDSVRRSGPVLEQEWHGMKPMFPVCSGGLHPGHVPKLVRLLGKDIIIQMGGGIHGHPEGTKAGAAAARQAVDVAMSGLGLRSSPAKRRELSVALKHWKG